MGYGRLGLWESRQVWCIELIYVGRKSLESGMGADRGYFTVMLRLDSFI